jgi:hypothetical protein
MSKRMDPPFRVASYGRLLAVELAGALILAALALLPFLFLKVLFSPAFYGLLVAVVAVSLLATLLRWVLSGIRSVEVDASGIQLRRGRGNLALRVERSEIREVRIRKARIVIAFRSVPGVRRPAHLAIRRDGFPAGDFRELARRLTAFRKRP